MRFIHTLGDISSYGVENNVSKVELGYTRTLWYEACQMSSWWTKVQFIPSIQDVVTNRVQLYSVYQVSPYQPNAMVFAPIATNLAFLRMLFILANACTARNFGHLKNK